jgi:hypothetical protein
VAGQQGNDHVLGTAGEGAFHTYTSARALRRNYAAAAVPGPAWTPMGGALAVAYSRTGRVDGAASRGPWSHSDAA